MTELPDETSLRRAEQLAERMLPDRSPKKSMMIIVNPYATTVSDRLRNLILYALQSRYDVEVADTQQPEHAIELCRDAAREGYDVVAAFGGDGTVNEAANGLAGTDTPLTVLPGGATNVYCRVLGIPNDIVDATEQLLRVADDFRPRRVDLGLVDDRRFIFSAGIGLDASVVERVDRHPHFKSRLGPWYYAYAAVTTFSRRYLIGPPPRVRVHTDGQVADGVTVIVQVCDPYTYFGRRPIRINEAIGLDDGAIGVTVLERATPLELPTVGIRALSGRPRMVAKHRFVRSFPGVHAGTIEALDPQLPFPMQVDGDYIGDHTRVRLGVERGALTVVS